MPARKRRVPVTVRADSALGRLAERLVIPTAIGPPQAGPQVLQLLLDALHMDGWSPPKMSQSEGGRIRANDVAACGPSGASRWA